MMVVVISLDVFGTQNRKGPPSIQRLALVPVRQPKKQQLLWRCGAFALLGVRARKPGGLILIMFLALVSNKTL